MNLCAIVVSLLLAGAASGFYHHVGIECQRWDYILTGNNYYLQCVSYEDKEGVCPSDCLHKNSGYDFQGITCDLDQNCPFGYKCCRDQCYRNHKICKPAIAYTKPIKTA